MHVYLCKTCPPCHYHNTFMATGTLGHTHLRLHVVDIQDSNKAQVNIYIYGNHKSFKPIHFSSYGNLKVILETTF